MFSIQKSSFQSTWQRPVEIGTENSEHSRLSRAVEGLKAASKVNAGSFTIAATHSTHRQELVSGGCCEIHQCNACARTIARRSRWHRRFRLWARHQRKLDGQCYRSSRSGCGRSDGNRHQHRHKLYAVSQNGRCRNIPDPALADRQVHTCHRCRRLCPLCAKGHRPDGQSGRNAGCTPQGWRRQGRDNLCYGRCRAD